jgi:hypothetical protein
MTHVTNRSRLTTALLLALAACGADAGGGPSDLPAAIEVTFELRERLEGDRDTCGTLVGPTVVTLEGLRGAETSAIGAFDFRTDCGPVSADDQTMSVTCPGVVWSRDVDGNPSSVTDLVFVIERDLAGGEVHGTWNVDTGAPTPYHCDWIYDVTAIDVVAP